MSDSDITLQAIKLKGHIGPGRKLEITESCIDLPEGDVEVILLYLKKRSDEKLERLSPLAWPTLNGGRYLGGALRQAEIYGDDGR